jgi:hypothetical protein
VEDHHVDRPDVEARRRVKLTGTNRSFDLIALVAKARQQSEETPRSSPVLLHPFFAGLVALAR